jgi:L-threonylcarbamoyladenylate synthase
MTVLSRTNSVAIISLLAEGAVGVMPTDTVYGIVARAADREAVSRLYTAKHREGKPGTVIAANIEQLVELGIDEDQLQVVAPFWPNPLSVVVPDQPHLAYLDQGKQSLAVRIPSDQQIHDLLLQTGPLLTSSANQPGQPPATTVTEAQAYFGTTVDFYVDGGTTDDVLPSTLIKLRADGAIEILRQGAIQLPE